VLFSASIAENIGYARPGASKDEVIAVAQAANAHEFILRLPQGYDTQVGDRGVQLSGGQRQRVAIARAFLKDSPVLILDEPTSAVDSEAETAILAAVRRLMRQRTVILITHRATLLEGCTGLIALENRRVVTDTTRLATPGLPAAAPPRATGSPKLRGHPAIHAWCRLHPQAEPLGITPLRVRRKKNMVYRLEGAGPAGLAVVAKRCPKPVARTECAVYETLLPRLSVPALRHYGSVEEPDSEYAWLFMEEATGVDYSNLLFEHRSRAAHWLGRLHVAAADVVCEIELPEAGPSRYLELSRETRAQMRQHLDNPVLSQDDVYFIQGIESLLEELEAHWDRVVEACAGVPSSLVHGDFNGKNIRLRPGSGDAGVIVFDWEHAGWGVPAVDLAQLAVPTGRLSANVDIPTYWATVRERWTGLSLEDCWRLAYGGTLLRTLTALYWDAQHLPFDWAHAFVGGMQGYAADLEAALERLDWGRRPSVPWQAVTT